jgi:hypothetical protein
MHVHQGVTLNSQFIKLAIMLLMLLLLSLLFDLNFLLLSFPSLAGTSLLSLTHLHGHEKIHMPFHVHVI